MGHAMKHSFLTMFHEGKLFPTQLFPEGGHALFLCNFFESTKMDSFSSFFFILELPVKYFKTVEELGHLVIKDWLQVLDSLYPQIEKKIFTSVHDADFREWSTHESFAKTRRRVFVQTDFIRMTSDTLTRHAQYPSRGASGRESSCSLTKINEGTFLTGGLGTETFPSIIALVGEWPAWSYRKRAA